MVDKRATNPPLAVASASCRVVVPRGQLSSRAGNGGLQLVSGGVVVVVAAVVAVTSVAVVEVVLAATPGCTNYNVHEVNEDKE